MKREYKGIEYTLRFNHHWRVISEIGNFYGYDVREVMAQFRAAVNAGPQ